MSTKFLTTLTLLAFVFLMIVGLWAVTNYYAHAPERISQNESLQIDQETGALRTFFQYRCIPSGDIHVGLAVS